ncbi:radical SAM protein, partial [Candidatus Aenigmatarchaeota archaeon]
MKHIYSELLERVRKEKVTDSGKFEIMKTEFAREKKLPKIPKNAEILNVLEKDEYKEFSKLLMTKPIRTLSGVANIAVMWLPDDPKDSCPGSCIYCPQGSVKKATDVGDVSSRVPKSYTGTEPTTMRAVRNKFDPYDQIKNRLNHFHVLGQKTDKCELIIMGGTFTAWDISKQDLFVKRCFDAFNSCDSESLQKAQQINQTAKSRVIGLTIETRADYCKDEHIKQMLKLGCTRVELGIQSTSDKILKLIKRGHLSDINKEAIARLRAAGIKVCIHWMPGLTGLYG